MQALVETLRRRGFDAHVFMTSQEAAGYLRSQVQEGASVGIGGSVTVEQMGLADLLRADGHEVYWHWDVAGDEVDSTRQAAARADVYLSSANALTKEGAIVNTDGTGNRVAATIYGPRDVFFLVGHNKVVDDLQAALERIKNVATPLNARRLGIKTPCAVTGKCEKCLTPVVLCGATVILERPTNGHTVHVLLIQEDLGY